MTIKFVDAFYPHRFAKNANTKQVARLYFEVLSVGAYLALKENPNLIISKEKVEVLLTDIDFLTSVSGWYQTHKVNTIRKRIDYVKDGLMKNEN